MSYSYALIEYEYKGTRYTSKELPETKENYMFRLQVIHRIESIVTAGGVITDLIYVERCERK